MRRLLLTLAAASALAGVSAAPAAAQDDRRLSNLEKQVHELRSIVFQGRDTGQPVIVKPEGPDPAVTALQQRMDALEESIRRQNGQLEVLSHDIDQARQAAASARDAGAEARGQLQALTDRLARIENQLQAMAAAPPPASATVAVPPPPPVAPEPALRGRAGSAPPPPLAAEEQPPPAAPPATASDAFRRARQLLSGGDYPAATDAFQDYLARFGTSARAPEARYFLGESLFARESYPDAARAYAEALKGWPTAAWAPDGLVKLAQALQHLNRREQTCAALGEFDRRYAPKATAEVKERAAATAEQARCAAVAAEAQAPSKATPPKRTTTTSRTARPRAE